MPPGLVAARAPPCSLRGRRWRCLPWRRVPLIWRVGLYLKSGVGPVMGAAISKLLANACGCFLTHVGERLKRDVRRFPTIDN
jgi:hypothetical protein